MKIGILALQGAFIEHEKMLEELGCQCIELRKKSDLSYLDSLDGLVLPGGESTVQGKLLRDLDMFESIKNKIQEGLPCLATCAGLILLAEKLSNDKTVHLGTLPVKVLRNAYGRQLGSFICTEDFFGIGKIPMTFIRAPIIEECEKDVEILAQVNNQIVGVKYKNQLGISFHPELGKDKSLHKYFLNMCKNK